MIVLGVAGGFYVGNQDASATLMRDGKLVAAVEEERLCSEKFARGRMPTRAIRAVLAEAKISIEQVDVVATSWPTYPDFKQRVEEYFRFTFGHCPKIQQYDHHLCHAASTFFASGYDKAMVVTYDLSGDNTSTALWRGAGTEITPIANIKRPNSLGIFYSIITQYLGFDRDSDEYKVMGLAAYGEPKYDLSFLLKGTNGSYDLDLSYTAYASRKDTGNRDESLFNAKLENALGLAPRRSGIPIDKNYINLAASCQARLEDVVIGMLKSHVPQGERLCIAGGVGLNCSLNGKLAATRHFGEIYIQPAAGDDGLSLGAAYLAAIEGGDNVQPMADAFLGPSYTPDTVQKWLDIYQLRYVDVSDPASTAARLVAEGKIVGWFRGRMEFGPRALGARSILADARQADMKNEINARVKFREEFRPFAPSVLVEDRERYFVCPQESPYMTMAVPVTATGAADLPATTHANGTARVQTVDAARNADYHRLISAFKEETGGCGAVLNTSLNVMGQPLSCSPADAIRVFSCSGMDALVIENFLVEKERA
ncbi:MAG: carbamoyltransferase family protein [Gemmatimonadaceae bacterium]